MLFFFFLSDLSKYAASALGDLRGGPGHCAAQEHHGQGLGPRRVCAAALLLLPQAHAQICRRQNPQQGGSGGVMTTLYPI